MKKLFWITMIAFAIIQSVFPQEGKELPGDEQYVTIGSDGHLYLDGERIRFWGAIGKVPASSYADNEALVNRIKSLGFNMFRYGTSVQDYVMGDGSKSDLFDHFLYCCKKEGIHVWFTGLNFVPEMSESDVSIIDEEATEEEWKSVITQVNGRRSMCWAWDPRIREYRVREKVKILNHFNHYTGLRYADDPVFAVFELTNEEWWFHRMKRGQFLNLPQYFLDELYVQWNTYLKRKYHDQATLDSAWIGNLLPGESLDKQNVFLLPLMGDIRDDQASTLGVETTAGSVKNAFETDNFNGRRGADVIAFMLETWLNYKQAEADAVKSTGKAARLIPLVWDTGIGYDLQTQYMQQHADAIAHDSYWNGTFHTDPKHKRFPWISQLEELPKTGWDDPWLEHNKMEGKPFFVYETQIMQPAKYRAEYPMEIVKLASIQDWDIINWHYWGHPVPHDKDQPYDQKLDYVTRSHYTQGYHYQFDEVQQSSMTAAGAIFRNFLLDPAPNPTHVTIGKNSLLSWKMNNYGTLGRIFVPTVYRYGMRLEIDPSREEDAVDGPVIKNRGVYEPCPIEPTEQISHDWQKGHLIFDAPGVVMYTGFMAQYGEEIAFSNGLVLSAVSVLNPENMPYPVTEDEKYIEFCVTSTGEQPLQQADRLLISLVSTSFNSGFAIDEDAHAERPYTPVREWQWNLDHLTPGKAPVLVSRAGATISWDQIKGMKYRMLDWHFNAVEEGKVRGTKLQIPADKPVFLIELYR